MNLDFKIMSNACHICSLTDHKQFKVWWSSCNSFTHARFLCRTKHTTAAS